MVLDSVRAQLGDSDVTIAFLLLFAEHYLAMGEQQQSVELATEALQLVRVIRTWHKRSRH